MTRHSIPTLALSGFAIFLLIAPSALAQPTGSIDLVVELRGDAPPTYSTSGILSDHVRTPGERDAWNVTTVKPYTVLEFRVNGTYEVERAMQIVPTLHVPGIAYPFFYVVQREAVWDVDSPDRISNSTTKDGTHVIRLGIPGPANGTLTLERDVTPPNFTLGAIQNVTHFGFYQESKTDEPALGDLQIRKVGATDWNRNPTTELNYRQRFPVQGLSPNTTYEARLIVTDWAGNSITGSTYAVHSAPAPIIPMPRIVPLTPQPNSTAPSGDVVLSARVELDGLRLANSGLRIYLDKHAITEDLVFENGTLSYHPSTPLASGTHSVLMEATNAQGGLGRAQWTFTIAGERSVSAASLLGLFAIVGLATALLRRR